MGGVDEVLLIEHSLGGLIVRQAYLYALGADGNPPQLSPWVNRVSRMVLLASVNRGANGVDPHGVGASRLRFAQWLFRVFPGLQALLVYDVMRGSDFLTNLRLQWIRAFDKLDAAAPVVVQLLGTDDWLVKREDSIDVEQFRSAWHVDIPGAKHDNVYRLDLVDAQAADLRYTLIRSAMIDPEPAGGDNKQFDRAPETVVFVLHGIRANNRTWAVELAAEIRKLDPKATVIVPTYGYLSAAQFVIPATRRRALAWFQDQYSNVVAKNPNTDVRFVGHSNGTYILGESLSAIPAMRFSRVILVGSVLPTQYDWGTRVKAQQVSAVENHRSNADFPVSFLCSGLRGLRMRDVGPGGFDGFDVPVPNVTEEYYWYDGGHSAPLSSENIPQLARAVLGLPVQLRADPHHARKMFERFPRFAPWIVRLLVLAVVVGGVAWVGFGRGFSFARLMIALALTAFVYLALDLL